MVNTNSYKVVLGNTWLKKVRAILDFGALKMRFSWKGRMFDVALDINRGIRPKFIDDEERDEYEYMITQGLTKCHELLTDQWVIQFKKTKEEARALTRGISESAGF